MVTWFGRRRKRVDVPRLRSRADAPANVNRVALGELTPALVPFLGQAAYIQLSIFEALTQAINSAPTPGAKVAVSRVAATSLAKHHGLVAELERNGANAGEAMAPYTERIDHYRRITRGDDWYELVTACYLTAGILDDFFLSLASGLPRAAAERIETVLSSDAGGDILAHELQSAIDTDPRLASRLAMWGRRLVGDTLLVARSALAMPPSSARDEEKLEPVVTEVIAAHTRRMDAIGLTA
ncbi:MAG TPA: ferritin-like fold-containing protein [Lacisediminihabitans sp.]|nr:ferritin-like fold-containing protein [Lacisediminihabitans sp.]HXD60348.1 ferritin-like fold-containing protein [Lacisediminihabitans sp.]